MVFLFHYPSKTDLVLNLWDWHYDSKGIQTVLGIWHLYKPLMWWRRYDATRDNMPFKNAKWKVLETDKCTCSHGVSDYHLVPWFIVCFTNSMFPTTSFVIYFLLYLLNRCMLRPVPSHIIPSLTYLQEHSSYLASTISTCYLRCLPSRVHSEVRYLVSIHIQLCLHYVECLFNIGEYYRCLPLHAQSESVYLI
jgi:hypothetical protein